MFLRGEWKMCCNMGKGMSVMVFPKMFFLNVICLIHHVHSTLRIEIETVSCISLRVDV